MSCLFPVPQPLSRIKYPMLNFPYPVASHLTLKKFWRHKLHTVMRTPENVPGPRPMDTDSPLSLWFSVWSPFAYKQLGSRSIPDIWISRTNNLCFFCYIMTLKQPPSPIPKNPLKEMSSQHQNPKDTISGHRTVHTWTFWLLTIPAIINNTMRNIIVHNAFVTFWIIS